MKLSTSIRQGPHPIQKRNYFFEIKNEDTLFRGNIILFVTALRVEREGSRLQAK